MHTWHRLSGWRKNSGSAYMKMNIIKTDRCPLIGLAFHSSELLPCQHNVTSCWKQDAAVNDVIGEVSVLRMWEVDFNWAGYASSRSTRTSRKKLVDCWNCPAEAVIPDNEGRQHRSAWWHGQLDWCIEWQWVHRHSTHVQPAFAANPLSAPFNVR